MKISIESKHFNYDTELGIVIRIDGQLFEPGIRCLSPNPQNVGANDDPKVVAAVLRELADALENYKAPGSCAGDVVSIKLPK